MKATGIYRKIDSLGRLVIPVEIRRAYDIDVNHELEIFTQGGYIMLGKRQDKCIMCNGDEGLTDINNKYLCHKCVSSIAEAA